MYVEKLFVSRPRASFAYELLSQPRACNRTRSFFSGRNFYHRVFLCEKKSFSMICNPFSLYMSESICAVHESYSLSITLE